MTHEVTQPGQGGDRLWVPGRVVPELLALKPSEVPLKDGRHRTIFLTETCKYGISFEGSEFPS